jgi:hypothetical protein
MTDASWVICTGEARHRRTLFTSPSYVARLYVNTVISVLIAEHDIHLHRCLHQGNSKEKLQVDSRAKPDPGAQRICRRIRQV